MPSHEKPQKSVEKLGPDDQVVQKRVHTPRNVDVDHAFRVPDRDWEIGTAEDQLEKPSKPSKQKPEKPAH